jgi:hypothetical protein
MEELHQTTPSQPDQSKDEKTRGRSNISAAVREDRE